ncbi:MAG: hypothetical protein MZV64_48525 [Ignavibacteriales bacterium]|nr:hypothetical protein [Ignavibacteriales bacterium]
MVPLPSCTPISLTVAASASDVPSSHIFQDAPRGDLAQGRATRAKRLPRPPWNASCGATVTERPAFPGRAVQPMPIH